MTSIDSFLVPISQANPSGLELRNDARFHAIERILLPATQSARAQAPDSEPAVDWDDVLRRCEEVGADGHDLRLLVIVVRALAQIDGFRGMAQGLSLLTQAVETYWTTLHPVLRDRPSPRDAAVRRLNALFQLENDEDGLLCDLSYMALFSLRSLGRFTGADLAAGSLSRTAFLNETPPGLGEAERAAMAAQHEARVGRVRTGCRMLAVEEPTRLADLSEGVALARAALGRLEDRLSARLAEEGAGVTFARLGRFLERVATTLGQSGQSQDAAGTVLPQAGPSPATAAAAGGPSAAPDQVGGDVVTSRQDVERMLDRIIEFYEQTEPASPIPLLARRLRRMVPMTFLQLMEELAPSGMKEVRNLAGVTDEKTRAKGGAADG
ncbi:ImpA family type VI secretion system protein [Rubellimicrobium arenae]|uniref:type VI secretion system protein TssA n=1 Tax=Rubellimicrobium arenae TaxID=2817372 RepID=UPI001B316437